MSLGDKHQIYDNRAREKMPNSELGKIYPTWDSKPNWGGSFSDLLDIEILHSESMIFSNMYKTLYNIYWSVSFSHCHQIPISLQLNPILKQR